MVANSVTKQMTSSCRAIVAMGHKELWQYPLLNDHTLIANTEIVTRYSMVSNGTDVDLQVVKDELFGPGFIGFNMWNSWISSLVFLRSVLLSQKYSSEVPLYLAQEM